MQLRLACADFSFPLLKHDHALELIAMLGFQGVDVGLFEGRSHLQPSDTTPRLAAAARDLLHRVQARGLQIADVFFQATSFADRAANHPDAAERQRGRELFLRMLEFTLRCNAAHLTGLPGLHWQGESLNNSLDRAADELAWRAEQARQLGVTFSVEPHLGSLVPTPAAALHLLERAPGLTLTLDYCHFTYQGIADDAVEPLVRHASHFHARAAAKGRLQAPLKENTIDYGRVLQALDRVGYRGYVAVEYVWIDWERCNEVDNVSETIMLRDLLRKEGARNDS